MYTKDLPLLVATGNAHKLAEISELLQQTVVSLNDVADAPEVVEDGDSFEANAIKKAATLAAHSGMWTLSDDSGLEVDALDGAPGIYSARYAGDHGNDTRNNAKLLAELDGVHERGAQFRCVIALCSPEGESTCFDGVCRGRIAHVAKGDQGFGYDPLFVPDGYEQSFAELGAEIKQRISHRARALAAFRAAVE